MKQQSTLYSWSRTVIGKSVGLLSLCFALTTAAYAQDAATLNVPKPGSVTRQLQKRAHHSKHPLPQLPMASELVRRVAHDASGQPLNFPERVWFPGEWEEVKAVCVSPMYYHFVPGYEEDEHYGATPIVEGYASYIYQENKLSERINKGNGNSWSGTVPASCLLNGQKVDYYIQATSNNGKTITKPINAAHGGYFCFTPDNTVAYNADVFDFGTISSLGTCPL